MTSNGYSLRLAPKTNPELLGTLFVILNDVKIHKGIKIHNYYNRFTLYKKENVLLVNLAPFMDLIQYYAKKYRVYH